jgi:hypothetical protein
MPKPATTSEVELLIIAWPFRYELAAHPQEHEQGDIEGKEFISATKLFALRQP